MVRSPWSQSWEMGKDYDRNNLWISVRSEGMRELCMMRAEK